MLGKGCVHLIEGFVLGDGAIRGCEEAYRGFCIDVEAWVDPELVGFSEEPQVCSSYRQFLFGRVIV